MRRDITVVESSQLSRAYEDLKSGRLTRRAFLERAAVLGAGLPLALFLAQTAGGNASAQDATPIAAPAVGTEGQTRGSGGGLKILQWQGATNLSVHTTGSFKDMLAAALVTEPLMHYMPDGTPIPNLVKEVPSLENEMLAEDLLSVVYSLREGVTWSDGEPFTANDVVFTWQWIMNPENESTNLALYSGLANVEAIDDLTVKLTFTEPQLGWYAFFTSSTVGGIYPQHILSAGQDANDAFRTNPIGTGPYVVSEFVQGDHVSYTINGNYREANKPSFATVELKGGGDATSAGIAVLQTGEYDFAWNLQVPPKVLDQMVEEGGKGDLVVVPGTSVEWITLNFSDPYKEVDGQKSQWQTPHPFLTDKVVRQALTMSVPRDTIATELYSGPPDEPPTANVLVGIPQYTSTITPPEPEIDQARLLLDSAGWTLDGDTRKKGDVELKMNYVTTVNPVRQETQAVIKQAWKVLGVDLNLQTIDSGIFFDASAGNEQNVYHMYWDCHEYAFSPASPFPLSYMQRWVSHNGANIPQKENGWSQLNEGRYNNPDYDALYDQVAKETDPEKAAQTFIAMNDMLVNDFALIPMVQRAAEKYGISKSLRKDNIAGGAFEALYWNIANWNKVE
jgi:peptide/nickel transport system substrate-binding protein